MSAPSDIRRAIRESPVIVALRSALDEDRIRGLFVVGGALRDVRLARATEDFDFVVAGDARARARELAKRLGARYVLLDEAWGVVRLVWSPPMRKGQPFILDFAPMRGVDIREDLLQRDFTCNAMAMGLSGGMGEGEEIWEDPTGGLGDLDARIIRMVHPRGLREDPLRLLRAFRMACTLDCEIEAETLRTIGGLQDLVTRPAAERIREEVYKILACEGCGNTLRKLDHAGVLRRLFPELDALHGVRQGASDPLDAWEHSLEALRVLDRGIEAGFPAFPEWRGQLQAWLGEQKHGVQVLRLATLFHDVGQPGTRTVGEDGVPHFFGHTRLGAELTAGVLRRLRASRSDEERVRGWVRHHTGPLHLARAWHTGRLTERAKIRFLRRMGPDAPGALLVAWAHAEAAGGPLERGQREAVMGVLRDLFLLHLERDATGTRLPRLVSGKDLMEELGIPPGPLVGRLLSLIDEARVQGRVRSRAEALRLAASLFQRLG